MPAGSLHFRERPAPPVPGLDHFPAHLLHPDRPDLMPDGDRLDPWARIPWPLRRQDAAGGLGLSVADLEALASAPGVRVPLAVSGDLLALVRAGVQGVGLHCPACADWPDALRLA